MNWWDIALELKDPFDYDEFVKACLIKEFSPIPISEYAQKVGMLMVAIKRFKGVTPEEAYKAFIQEMNEHYSGNHSISTSNPKGGCSSCGGKK